MSVAEFVKSECGTDPADREYAAWVNELEAMIGGSVDHDGIAFDLFIDGASPAEAADEMRFC